MLLSASTSMKSCHASTRGSWTRRHDNGERYTRCVHRHGPGILRWCLLATEQALQLLEYIIKHGSERVVDDARSHLGTIKMLRNFHYIDEKGKDQGINGEPSRIDAEFPGYQLIDKYALSAESLSRDSGDAHGC